VSIMLNGNDLTLDDLSKIVYNREKIELDQDAIKKIIKCRDYVEKIVKCFNPKCVTNIQGITTKFNVVQDHKGTMKLACHYCEKTMGKESIEFL